MPPAPQNNLGVYNIEDLRQAAKSFLPKGIFEFIDRGTEDDLALANNRAGFEKIKLVPRVLRDVSKIDPSTELFGRKVNMPVIIAPTGGVGLASYRGEMSLAEAAHDANIPLTLSFGSTVPIEEVADKAKCPLWLQLYMWEDHSLTYWLLDKAKAVGFQTLIVTVDTAVNPNREYNQRNDFGLPFRITARNSMDVISHPRWLTTVLMKYLMRGGLPTYANLPPEKRHSIGGRPAVGTAWRNADLTWEVIKDLRKSWKGVFMIKGIVNVPDAVQAVNLGADGIIVSNHGGRNLDSSIATMDALPAIVDAIGDRATVIVDSGVRRGSDVIKALALGAKAVMVGRPTLYGLAFAGTAGASRALTIFNEEIVRIMGLTGSCNISEITPDLIYRPDLRNRPI